jgi:hypothetical protein
MHPKPENCSTTQISKTGITITKIEATKFGAHKNSVAQARYAENKRRLQTPSLLA